MGAVAILLATVMAAWAAEGDTHKVTIVLTSDAETYQRLGKSIQTSLERERIESRTVRLDQMSEIPLDQSDASQTFITIGTWATRDLAEKLPPQTPLLYCLADTSRVAGLLTRPRTYGVSGQVSLKSQAELIREALPGTRSIGMLYRGGDTYSHALMTQMTQALPTGWNVYAVDLDRQASFAEALHALFDRKPDLVWLAADPAVYNLQTVKSLMLEAVRRKVPIFGYSKGAVEAGALLGVQLNLEAQAGHTLELLKQIAKDRADGFPIVEADPARNHLESGFEIAVNLVVAQRIGVKLSPSFVERADFVRK